MRGDVAERITLHQLMALFIVSRLSQTLIFWGTESPVQYDEVWFVFVEALAGILFAWVLNRLWQRYPGLTLAEIFQAVLGKAVGRLLAILYAGFLLLFFSLTLRLTGEVFIFAFLPWTPISVLIGVVAGLAAWSARAGIEVLGRAAEVTFPILIGVVGLIFILLLGEIHFHLLWPPRIFHTGPIPHLQDLIGVPARTAELAAAGMMLPYLNDRRRILRAVAGAHLWLGVAWVLLSVSIYGVIGPEIFIFRFPLYTATQIISIADFVERIEGLLLAAWLLGMWVRCGLMLWAGSLSLARGLGLREHRPLVLPLAGAGITYAITQAEDLTELLGYLGPKTLTPFGLTFVLLIPLVALVVAGLRGQRGAAVSMPPESLRGPDH